MESNEAAAALAAMQDSRDRLAKAADCPPERHLVFALLLGGVVAAQAAPPMGTMLIEGLLGLAVFLVIAWDRKRTGMFINGYRAGRTRPLTFALLAVTLAIGGVGVWLKVSLGLVWAPVVCGGVVAVVAFLMSAAWQRIYRRELRDMP
jgi:hypothetical protein